MHNRHLLDLSRRVLEPEIMDDPQLDERMHAEALDGLARLNRASGAVSNLWQAIAPLAGRGPLRVLDVATGGSDVPVGLWQMAQRRKVRVEIDACDRSATAIDHGRQRVARCGAQVRFFQVDAVLDDLPAQREYDVVMCSLFLHHLTDDQATVVLAKMATGARRLVTASDLIRSRMGLAIAWGASRLLTRSPVVHTDAVRSVRAAFTRGEIKQRADAAGLSGATVSWRWPWRFLLRWERL